MGIGGMFGVPVTPHPWNAKNTSITTFLTTCSPQMTTSTRMHMNMTCWNFQNLLTPQGILRLHGWFTSFCRQDEKIACQRDPIVGTTCQVALMNQGFLFSSLHASVEICDIDLHTRWRCHIRKTASRGSWTPNYLKWYEKFHTFTHPSGSPLLWEKSTSPSPQFIYNLLLKTICHP